MGLYRRGQIWWMAYTVNRRKVNETTHTANKRIAKRALDRRLGEIAEGRLQLPQTQSAPKLREWTAQFLSTVCDQNTKNRYSSSVRNLLAFFGQTKLCDIAFDQIDQFVVSRKSQEVRAATINRDLAVLRRLLRLAQKRRYIAFNPFDQVEMLNESRGRGQARILTFAEELRIESVVPQNSYFYPLLRVLVETGLRVYSEALRLRWTDIDFENHLLHVRQSKTAAGIRSIPLSHHCEDALLAWHRLLGGAQEQVFPSARVGDAPRRNIHRAWKRLLTKAQVPDTWLHDLRATFATRLSACGLSSFQIAQLLGHSSGRIIGTYAKSFDEGRRESIALLQAYRANHMERAERVH